MPKRDTHLAENLRVTEDDHSVLRSSQSNVQSPGIVQETNALMFVTSDTGQDDVVLFTALERIDTGDFNFLVKVLLERSVVLHVVHDV